MYSINYYDFTRNIKACQYKHSKKDLQFTVGPNILWCGWRDLNPHERTLTTPSRWRVCHSTTTAWNTNGASGQNRTVDTRIFSPLLYQLSYRGMFFCKKKWRPRSDLN